MLVENLLKNYVSTLIPGKLYYCRVGRNIYSSLPPSDRNFHYLKAFQIFLILGSKEFEGHNWPFIYYPNNNVGYIYPAFLDEAKSVESPNSE